jgi:hypothetical protein
MRQLPIEQQIFLIAEIVALLTLCVRMWWAGLHRIYAYFFGYLVLDFLQALIPFLVPLGSKTYRDLFVVSQGLIVAFYALVVLELYSKALHDLAGIASVARRYIRITLVLAIVIAVLPLRLEKGSPTMTGYLFTFERTVMSSLVVFLLLISGFLVYYPVPLGRNVLAYLAGYAVYFLTINTVALMQNLGYFWNRMLSTSEMVVALSCMLFWLLALNREGENKRMVVGHQWNHGDEQRLMAQLEAINSSLLRTRKNKYQ